MKIVRNKITYQVFYMFEDNEQIRINEYGLWSKIRVLDMKSDTHEIVEFVPRPDLWLPTALKYDENGWSIYDEVLYIELYDQKVQEEIEKKCQELHNLRLTKTYTSVEINFSDGTGSIQFRNEFDRANLSNVATGALALSSIDPTTLMEYRTEDNVIHHIPASEMVSIAMDVLSQKQAIISASWIHKDAIRALTTLDQIKAYNIYEGWPV